MENEARLTFTEHLEELRRRLLYCVLAIVLFSMVGFAYAREIIEFLMYPLNQATQALKIPSQLHFTAITEPLFQSFKIALYTGIFFSFPFTVWQIWLFVAPGLYRHERRYVTPFLVSASGLFLLGAAFAYLVAVPMAYQFLLAYAKPAARGSPSAPRIAPGFTLTVLPEQPKVSSRPATMPRKTPPPPSRKKSVIVPRPTRLAVHLQRDGRGGMQLRLSSPDLLPSQKDPLTDQQSLVAQLLAARQVDLSLSSGPLQQRYQLRYQPHVAASPSGKTSFKPIITIQSYLSVSSWFLIGFGLVFQIPLIIFVVVLFGVVTPQTLARYRRHAIVGILFLAAVLTPTGDPVNLMIMAVPMYILFEIGLLLARLVLTRSAVPPTDETRPKEP